MKLEESSPPSALPQLGASRALEVAVAFRQLAVMVAASIPITRALEILSSLSPDRELRSAFRTALCAVVKGHPLSRGLALRQDVFPELVLGLVRVGEQTGRLDELLGALATYLEKSARLRMRVRSALVYPCFMFGICLLTILVVPPLLFGGVFALLEQMGAQVPWLTWVLMRASEVSGSPWTYLAALGAGLGARRLYRRWMEDEEHRLLRDQLLLRLWGVGSCLRYVSISLFALSLEAQYSSGVPVVTGLRAAGRASGNLVLERAARVAAEAMVDGAELHQALARADFFPATFVHFMAAATESGTVGEMLERVVQITDDEVDQHVRITLAALEPAMLLAMGAFVGLIIVATLSPLLKVLESLTL